MSPRQDTSCSNNSPLARTSHMALPHHQLAGKCGAAREDAVMLWKSGVQRKSMSTDDRTFHSTTLSAWISVEAQWERHIIERLRRDIDVEYRIK